MKEQIKDNLFSANHRNAMIRTYGFTEAQTTTIDDLQHDYTLDLESKDEDHDCTWAMKGYCNTCSDIWDFLFKQEKGQANS